MISCEFDNKKPLITNVKTLFTFVSWLYREMVDGRVRTNKKELQENIDKLDITQSIAFVTLAETGAIDDITASEHAEVFIDWSPNTQYKSGQLRKYASQLEGEYMEPKLYRCIQNHTSQEDWTPDVSVSLWKLTVDPTEEFPEWSQPISAEDAYKLGDMVSYNNKHYESVIENNVWNPETYGWQEVN